MSADMAAEIFYVGRPMRALGMRRNLPGYFCALFTHRMSVSLSSSVRYCISDGLRDCLYENRTAPDRSRLPDGAIRQGGSGTAFSKLRRHVGAIMSDRIDVDRRRT